MKPRSIILVIIFALLVLAGCAPVQPAMEEPSVEEPMAETVVETDIVEKEAEEPIEEAPTSVPQLTPTTTAQSTTAPLSPTPVSDQPIFTPTPIIEPRVVEVEWPQSLYLGDSDIVRMALIPTKDGYTLTTEFPDHDIVTQDVPVIRPQGYELYAVGRLNGVGFTFAPNEDQVRSLPLEESVVWHWSLTPQQPGKQRITVTLLLRWIPLGESGGFTREAVAYSKGLDIRVRSFFGLTRGQAMITGLIGTFFGGGLSLFALVFRPFRRQETDHPLSILTRAPNPKLVIEKPSGLQLSDQEQTILQSLFSRYDRLVLQSEFLSGYSGARTLLLVPVHPDGRSDAHTIAKIGTREVIQREFQNYEAFVKHTLPPATARIQNAPVTLPSALEDKTERICRAAIQYTFISGPDATPMSLRQTLQKNPDPDFLTQLFETFGPNWWMQRRPYTFRISQEYDRALPAHYVIEPESKANPHIGVPEHILDGNLPPSQASLSTGDRVTLNNFEIIEHRGDGNCISVKGGQSPGQPRIRILWKGEEFPKNPTGYVTATRNDLMKGYVSGLDLFDWPDPLESLPLILEETLVGTQSIIHGDLNLENVLVGPGDLVWLIDFATTREGHPLVDFAHLEAEIIAHIIAPSMSVQTYQTLLAAHAAKFWSKTEQEKSQSHTEAALNPKQRALLKLRQRLYEIAEKCLSNPSQPREYHLAVLISCLGALKYKNLDPHQKHLLYLTAASLVDTVNLR